MDVLDVLLADVFMRQGGFSGSEGRMGGPSGCGGESVSSWIGDFSASWADFWAMELCVWTPEDCLVGLLGSEVSLGTLVHCHAPNVFGTVDMEKVS